MRRPLCGVLRPARRCGACEDAAHDVSGSGHGQQQSQRHPRAEPQKQAVAGVSLQGCNGLCRAWASACRWARTRADAAVDELQQQPLTGALGVIAGLQLLQRFLEPADRKTSHVTRHTSHVSCHTLQITSHTPHITPQTSHITSHATHVTCWRGSSRQVQVFGTIRQPATYASQEIHKTSHIKRNK